MTVKYCDMTKKGHTKSFTLYAKITFFMQLRSKVSNVTYNVHHFYAFYYSKNGQLCLKAFPVCLRNRAILNNRVLYYTQF